MQVHRLRQTETADDTRTSSLVDHSLNLAPRWNVSIDLVQVGSHHDDGILNDPDARCPLVDAPGLRVKENG